MHSRDFAYWLQGFFEIAKPEVINSTQTQMIKNHLNMVFIHEIDPSMPDPDGKLQDAHDGNLKPEGPPPVAVNEGFGPQKFPHWASAGEEIVRC